MNMTGKLSSEFRKAVNSLVWGYIAKGAGIGLALGLAGGWIGNPPAKNGVDIAIQAAAVIGTLFATIGGSIGLAIGSSKRTALLTKALEAEVAALPAPEKSRIPIATFEDGKPDAKRIAELSAQRKPHANVPFDMI